MNPLSEVPGMLLATACGLAGMAVPARAAVVVAAGQQEYAIKAQLLVELAAYVRWPGPPRQGRPFVIAVIGASNFGSFLTDYATRHTVQGRPIEIQNWNWPHPSGVCDLAFVCQSERGSAGEIMEWAGSRSVLTVCESVRLTEAGMLVGLVLDSGKVRIFLNRQAMTSLGFSASSQLLGYAQLIGAERPTR